MIKIVEYEKLYSRTYGLGQDISQDLTNLVKVASLFVKKSKIHNSLMSEWLDIRVIDKDINFELKEVLSTQIITPSHKQLAGTRTKKEANSLVQAMFEGQGERLAIVDWAASNYVSVTVAFGLIEFNRNTDTYYITELGEKAVWLLENANKEALDLFLLDRLLEYPYTAWMLRLLGNKPNQEFTKFDFGENFGFIDEAGFSTLPKNIYLDALAETYANDDIQSRKKLKSNYESTGDKYMRWLAGVLVDYGLVNSIRSNDDHIYNGKSYNLYVSLKYKISARGLEALRKVNGISSHRRTKKRVRWEYLAPKAQDSILKKTSRSLMLKYLSESKKGLLATELASKINQELPKINVSSEEVSDDIEGLNRIGIEISKKNDLLFLEEELFDFEIPIAINKEIEKNELDSLKDKVRIYLKNTEHHYLKGIDIAYKNRTSAMENTELEVLSADLLTKELGLNGKHMGGTGRPDGVAYNDKFVFVLDSKAYSKGFPMIKSNTDPMLRYLSELKARNINVKPHWWKDIPVGIKDTYFVYVSGRFTGEYRSLLQAFKDSTGCNGGALEIIKLLLLVENYKRKKINIDEVKKEILDSDRIEYDDYIDIYIQ